MVRNLLAVAMCALVCAGCPGPPAVDSQEAYADPGSGKAEGSGGLDHSTFDALLRRIVRDGGVDYAALAADPAPLDAYLETLAAADFEALSRDGKLALLINAYNAFTLRLIVDHYPLDSIKDIPDAERWKAVRWSLLGTQLSLDSLEHEYLRAKFEEPRIHFAINCASVGCPPLRAEAYTPERLEAQLEEQTQVIHSRPTWLRFDAEANALELTKLYSWFSGDFEQAAGSVLEFVARYAPQVAERLAAGEPPAVSYMDYDWSLNAAPAK